MPVRRLPLAPALALLAGLLAGPLGCKEATRELRNVIGERLQQSLSADDKPDTSSAPLPPELVGAKLSLYVECVNSTRVPLYAGFRQVNAASAAGKRARQTIDPVLEEAFEKCVRAQREGPLLQPPLPTLESAATVYLASARELAAAIAAVRAQLAEPEPERPARGKPAKAAPEPAPEPAPDPFAATDPKTRFTAAFHRWDDTRRTLDETIDDLQATVDAAVLATVERKQGKRIEWHTRDLMRASKPYVRCLGDHDEITAKICEAFFAPLAEARAAFHRVHDGDRRAAADVFWMPQFVASLEDFFTSADALRAALHDNTARSADLGRTLREYNDLVHDFDLLNFTAAGP